jgi:hypothetical protein
MWTMWIFCGQDKKQTIERFGGNNRGLLAIKPVLKSFVPENHLLLGF